MMRIAGIRTVACGIVLPRFENGVAVQLPHRTTPRRVRMETPCHCGGDDWRNCRLGVVCTRRPRGRSGRGRCSPARPRTISASWPAAPRQTIALSSRTSTRRTPTSSPSHRVASARSRASAKRLLKTWEKTEVVITLDTRAEPGRKDGTIEVEFDLPFPAKVQLHVHSFIRGDVVMQPGVVEFGSVESRGRGEPRH